MERYNNIHNKIDKKDKHHAIQNKIYKIVILKKSIKRQNYTINNNSTRNTRYETITRNTRYLLENVLRATILLKVVDCITIVGLVYTQLTVDIKCKRSYVSKL